MHIRPILSTLARHKTAASLILIEIALSCAILCNAMFIIGTRVSVLSQPSGIAEDVLIDVRVSGIGNVAEADVRTQEDLAVLRQLPGVTSAAVVNQVPFQAGSWNTLVSTEPDGRGTSLVASQYNFGRGALETFGLTLVAGRDFLPEEHIASESLRGKEDLSHLKIPVILNQAVADRLFPEGQAAGRSIYMGPYLITVVGVVDTLKRATMMGGDRDASVIFPMEMNYNDGGFYLLRVADPAQRADVMTAAVRALERNDPNRLIREPRTYASVRDQHFSADRDMVGLLVIVCVLLLLVTALGIVGLASFWVGQRTRQIGIRRALGATRGQILGYFLTENVLLTSGGIVLGMLLTYGLNQWLMGQYALPRLPWMWLPVGALVLWLLGLASVYGPARRAAGIAPAVATRAA